MRSRMPVSRTTSVVISGVLVGALALGVVILSALALERASGTPPTGEAAPPPSFTFAPRPDTETPAAPTETAAPPEAPAPVAVVPREAERFLAMGSGAWWRAVAGACGAADPLVERSTDSGRTWSDVTPRYRDVREVHDLVAFAQTEADLIGALGEDCETQLLRTFTQGRFWEPYEDILAVSTYLDATGVVIDGDQVEAPCAEPRSVRSAGDVTALICDGVAYRDAGDGWAALEGAGILALDVWDGAIVGATTSDDCDGIAVVRLDEAATIGCVPGDPTTPTAVAVTGSSVGVWNGDTVTALRR